MVRNDSSQEGFIYIITDGEFIKIGWAMSVELRRCDLQCGNVRKLSVLVSAYGSQEKKRAMHKVLRRYHVRGEWFEMSALRKAKQMLRDD